MSKSFSSTMPEEGNNLMIVDGFNLAFRYKHAKKRNFAVEYLNTIGSFANSYSASDVIILSDGGSEYRKRIYSDYKGDRKRMRANQSKEEAQEFEDFMQDWKLAFDLCSSNYSGIQYIGVEADDIAAYIATRKEVLDKYDHIWLLSTDRDWDLLITDKVSRFSYRTRKETTLENWNEHYDYSPEEHISVKALQGDKSDSIPGVAGIGEKRAAALVKEYGSVYDIYTRLPINDKRVFMQNLNAFGDQLLLNCRLMDLVEYSEEAIGDNIDDLNNKIEDLCQ